MGSSGINAEYMGSVAPVAMGITSILLAYLIMGGERTLIRGDDSSFVDGGNDCCSVIAVSVGGSYAELSGDYELKENRTSKPEEVCLNGCVYTKYGLPSYDEFCFKGESVAGGVVQCKATTTAYDSTTPAMTTTASSTSTTTAVQASAEVAAQASELENLAANVTDTGLKDSLTGVVSTINDLSSSLSDLETLVGSRRAKRETSCSSLPNIIAKYGAVETKIQSVIDKIQAIFDTYPSLSTDYPTIFNKINGYKTSFTSSLAKYKAKREEYQEEYNRKLV
eukprot:TRINITY_DN14120_c0_g1_i1.p1 TRINITY_DN14120_c0_g1~~TRINITY_DN14120_c0_g1_i1.p1  ORF type:complete len:280 (-),score=81.52 TRINITY_DN14120_c0_g1_i1:176-1015(-)